MKNILIIYYSQSGQLKTIAENIIKPLSNSEDINVDWYEIKMKKEFPFPWNKDAFFDVFPETFLQKPSEIEELPEDILNKRYDLILFHYQVWYLSPSVPVTSFLKHPKAKIIFQNTPVVTINGSRNMWVMAQEKMKVLLKENNAVLKGNIALVDRVGNLISVVTIVKWMFSGVKKRYLGIFPLPGVSDKDILESSKFGETILKALQKEDFSNLQKELVAQGAVKISSYLVKVDKTANKIFKKWSSFIEKRSDNRKFWLKIFNVYLWFAIWLISPIVYILHIFTYPLKRNTIQKEKQYYQGV